MARLAAGHKEAGWHVLRWGGGAGAGGPGAAAPPGSGVYFVRLIAEGRAIHRRLVWIR